MIQKNLRGPVRLWRSKPEAFVRVGGLVNLGNGYGDMIDWFARARAAGVQIKVLEETLARRRIHSESLSFNAAEARNQDFLKAAVRALERKRQSKN